MVRELDTPYVHYEIRDKLLIATFKKGLKIDVEIAKEIVKDRLSFTEGKMTVAIVYNQGVVSLDKKARDFFSSPQGNENLKAGAIILDSSFTAVLGNFFLSVNKPNIPARLFTDTDKAIKWLKKFANKLNKDC